MKHVILPMVLGLLGATLFLTSVALAAPNQPAALPVTQGRFQIGDTISDTDSISDTSSISHTTSVSHPVASAIAEYFEEYFGVDASEIAALHDEGLGFGVIAHAYFVGNTLGIPPSDVLAEFQAGTGWGEIIKGYGLHPGLAGRGGNLGSIMSDRDQTLPPGQLKKLPSEATDTFVPPGQLKKNQDGDGSGFVPPGQLKKSDGDDSDESGGPPSVSPGQDKDKGKKDKKP
jgi:hypothetical protein